MSRVLQLSLTALLGLTLASPALAQVIILPNGHAQASTLSKQPTRGMTMQQVRSQFGTPLKKLAPTPTAPNYPTIARWIYADYTVYFADKYVIHTVVHTGKTAAKP
jgi:hypothetical protein